MSLLGYFLGLVFGLLPTKPRMICSLQLKKFLGKPELTPFVFAHIGRVLIEALLNSPKKNSFDAPDFDKTLALLERDKGLLVLTAHFGAWDLLGSYAVSRGVPLYAIGRPARRFQSFLEKVRARHGIRTIWRTGSGGAKEIEELLLNGNVIAALVDQDTKVKSIPVDFFGKKANTPVTVVNLALSKNIPIATAFIRREKNRFVVTTEEIKGNSAEEILKQFNIKLEEQIRLAPEQWVWFHQRWRTQSDGTRLSFNDYINFLRS